MGSNIPPPPRGPPDFAVFVFALSGVIGCGLAEAFVDSLFVLSGPEPVTCAVAARGLAAMATNNSVQAISFMRHPTAKEFPRIRLLTSVT